MVLQVSFSCYGVSGYKKIGIAGITKSNNTRVFRFYGKAVGLNEKRTARGDKETMIGLEYEKIFYDHLELKAMIKIYNKLKKQIEELAEGSYLKTELQKILDEGK